MDPLGEVLHPVLWSPEAEDDVDDGGDGDDGDEVHPLGMFGFPVSNSLEPKAKGEKPLVTKHSISRVYFVP